MFRAFYIKNNNDKLKKNIERSVRVVRLRRNRSRFN